MNDQLAIEKIKEEILKFLESNENGNMINQNLQDTTKAVLKHQQDLKKKPNDESRGSKKTRIN